MIRCWLERRKIPISDATSTPRPSLSPAFLTNGSNCAMPTKQKAVSLSFPHMWRDFPTSFLSFPSPQTVLC